MRPGQLGTLVQAVFAPGGPLSGHIPGFAARSGQLDMAAAVATALEDRAVLAVEAGTGVGKTFAYLVPALLSGERVLVSTATKALQDQLFGRDLPLLVRALGLPVRTALLKGRGNYLCLQRMEQARQHPAMSDRVAARTLGLVERWAHTTRSGDLAELPGLDERSPVMPLVTSTRDNCLGAQCPQFKACHVNLARREALGADVVVINHHLFFADLAVRESGMAELLPSVGVAIFDEAHQLNEIGIQFLGEQLSTAQLLDLVRDALAAGLQHARGLQDWSALCGKLERAARDLRLAAGPSSQTKLRWVEAVPEGVEPTEWTAALGCVQQACAALEQALQTVTELTPDFVRLQERAQQQAGRAQAFASACAVEHVRWADVGHQLRLVQAPLDIAVAIRERVLAPDGQEATRSLVFTSATLGDEPTLAWFTAPAGLSTARVLQVGSPFDYASQAALYVPQAFPRPADVGHSAAVAQLVTQSLQVLGGATLVLTTSLRALRSIGQALQREFPAGSGIEVLVQGEMPKRRLMERFREGAGELGTGCVLVASASFWEGFDVPGEALQLVVIDKLPFPPPGDPLVEARLKRIEAEGGSSFSGYSIPEAAIALKQGAGRLIRTESDQGLLVVCDTRLTSMGYGKRLLAALPPMARLAGEVAYLERLRALRPAAVAPTPAATKSATTPQ